MQVYKIWNLPVEGKLDVTVESLTDDRDGLKINLLEHKSGRMLNIHFEYHVLYMNRDESDFAGEVDLDSGLGHGSFYKVVNSKLEKSLKLTSLRQYDKLTHFAIVTEADCIDILAEEDPVITVY